MARPCWMPTDAAGDEGAAVADAVDLVEDRHGRVTGSEEVGVEGVHRVAGLDRAGRRHQGLARHLTPEDALAALGRAHAPEDVHLDRFQVEQFDHAVERRL